MGKERPKGLQLGTLPARVYAIAGGLWTLGYMLGLLGAFASSTFVLLTLAAMIATVVTLWVYRPYRRWPFVLIIIGLVLFVAGGAARTSLNTLGDLSAGRSIVPDALTLPGYVLVGAGLAGFARARRGGRADV